MKLFGKSYDRNLRNHIKGGNISKIITFIIFVVFAGLGLLCEWWSIGVYADNFLLGIVSSMLSIALIWGTVQFGFVNCVVCFKATAVGVFESTVDKIALKALEKQAKEGGADITQEQIEEEKAKIKKGAKWVDVLLGLLYLAVSVALFVLACYIFIDLVLIR